MSRPKVVKEIWNYVKAHDLQDPNDKRYIICDDKLKPIFGDKVHMFTMNKVLSGFMYKPEEIAGGATKSEQPSGNGTPMMDMLSPVKSEGSSEDGSGSVAGSMSSSMPMIFKEEDIHA